MCGIAGIYRFQNLKADPEMLRRMTRKMAHRGPDADGHFVENKIGLGHRRLSIIDLSPAGNQPYVSADGRYRMVFNGELYNFRNVRAEIKDHQFKSSGDTEVLMEAWARWGMEGVKKLKGMFSFAVWDTQENELVICRDRLGVKPLYYYQDNEYFLFSSEIRPILETGLVPRKLNRKALSAFLSYQSVNGEESIIEGIKELRAGHYMRVSDKEVSTHKYWNISDAPEHLSAADYNTVTSTIKNLLRNAVEERLVSDVPVGAFLSGGIDSSVVVGIMAEVSAATPETFNIAFSESDFDESHYAELVAKKFNTRHHKILLRPETMLENLLPALDAMDTPSGDGINSYVVSMAIKKAGITVALSGIGGDELFAGYPFFNTFRQLRKFKDVWRPLYPLRKLAAALQQGEGTRKSRIRQLLTVPQLEIEHLYPVFRQILPPEYIHRLTNLPGYTLNPFDELLSVKSKISSLPEYSQVSVAEYLGYTQHTLLKDTDQMSMAASLEVREPFFDHELVQYVLNVPDRFKTPSFPKKLLVESMGDLLPPEIVHRKKQGFVFPWQQWMKNELRQFCTEKILSMAERDFIKKEALLSQWETFLKEGNGGRWMEIWIFIVLEYWLEKNDIR